MTEQIYFCTSSHFHPIKDPHEPLCLVWIAEQGHYDNVLSKVYRSHNFPEMLNMAINMANQRGIKLTVLSTNVEPELIYHKQTSNSKLNISAQ